jgi:hypothetical protein
MAEDSLQKTAKTAGLDQWDETQRVGGAQTVDFRAIGSSGRTTATIGRYFLLRFWRKAPFYSSR